MSRSTFKNYAALARSEVSSTEAGGRYNVQADAERLVIHDVVQKLRLEPANRLLEIGCGPGLLLIPLTLMCQESTGIDHPEVIEKLHSRFSDPKLSTLSGNFLDIDIEGEFDRILIYSVVNCLGSREEVAEFIGKAVGLLAPGGRLLIGDVPNKDVKDRFLRSPAGQSFQAEWEQISAEDMRRYADTIVPLLEPDSEFVIFTDSFVLELLQSYRSAGIHSYVLPQPSVLPFGNTREDILIVMTQ